MISLWMSTTNRPAARTPLTGTRKADVAVIGGGLAGVLTAHYLKQRGADVVVLETNHIGSGQTQRTTAKVTAQHGLCYASLEERLGAKAARQYARANQQAVEAYRRLIADAHIDCDWEETSAYLYTAQQTDLLEQEAAACQRAGLPANYVDTVDLPWPAAGAVRMDEQAQFHPLRFLFAVADGLTVYEQTRVLRVEGGTVFADHGQVEAKAVVFATHYPFVNVPGYYFLRMHQERSYVLALENAPFPPGMYYGVDPECAWSLRRVGNVTLLGGGNHRTGENEDGGQYDILRGVAASYFPGAREVSHWSAQDCMTLDGVPYIGRFSRSRPNWYVSTGFEKWGMTSSMAAAHILCDAIDGKRNACAAVFSPRRFHLSASAKQLAVEAAHAVKGLAKTALAVPQEVADRLPPGHGGVVEWDGHKAGVYKDEEGQVYAVSTACPHLGCQLTWNPDEKSWDCPCHGSRFSYTGDLIDNPAQEGLGHV